MKRSLLSTAVAAASLSLISSVAMAGGLDRSGQDTSIIMDSGNVIEITNISVSPKITGTWAGGSTSTGDVAPDYSMTNIGMRFDVSDNIGIAVINDSPFGANVNWTNGVLNLTKGDLSSDATTVLGSYAVGDSFKVFVGVTSQSMKVTASVPAVGGYELTGAKSSGTGYVMGAGIENPEIAMKVSLTYHGKVKHNMSMTETVGASTSTSTSTFYTPSSFNLDFQTGIAENTLLFGTIRRANWTETNVKPAVYYATTAAAGSAKSLLDYDQDTTTYNIGVGYRFNESWSAAVTYGTESAQNTPGGAFGPTDGFNKYGLGVTYSMESIDITLAAQQVDVGDTGIYSGATQIATMSDNKTTVTALKITAKF